ncbi:MAG: MotA/TolQ/ExbB proton channel family protein [Myxococcales bacterium]
MSEKLTLLFVNATFVALVAASALTWAIVIVKVFQQRRLSRQAESFGKAFAQLRSLPTSDEVKRHEGPVARVALVGADAWTHSETGDSGEPQTLELRRDLLERSLKQQLQRERRGAESGLALLASIGSTAPFVGLFGTVLGIVSALKAIGSSGSANLEVVAGPIGEALIATALGIAVAVPAVLAYNYFLRRLKTFAAELEEFANSFVGAALRSQLPSATSRGAAADTSGLTFRPEASL